MSRTRRIPVVGASGRVYEVVDLGPAQSYGYNPGLDGADGPTATRSCVDCGEMFAPVVESQRRCKWCNAVKLLG